MKLESKHEIMLCQKALYTKQLTYYYKLCEIYQALANHALNKYKLKSSNDFPIAKQIEEIYGTYLSKASKGDISFLERSTRARSFDDEEARLFKLFSNASISFFNSKLLFCIVSICILMSFKLLFLFFIK